jgi:hypothetical protein
MKNVTVSLDDETYRRARVKAAEMDSSLSALVRDFLNKLGSESTDFERRLAREKELRAQIAQRHPGFAVGECISRDELHDRSFGRP